MAGMYRGYCEQSRMIGLLAAMIQESPSPMSQFPLFVHLKQGLNSSNLRKALQDIRDGWRHRNLWGTMGLQDIKQRYRRSVIGPFWLTISMGVMVGALGLVWGMIFKQQMDNYLPYLCAGFVLWALISSLILEGTTAFTSGEGMIKQLTAPLSVHVYRIVWSNFIIFLHNIWILFIVLLWYGKNPGWVALLSLPAVGLLLMNGVWVGLLFGLLSARFRDIPQIIASVVQVTFFLTPIIWRPDMLPERALVLELNPFYYALKIVRDPLIGIAPTAHDWLMMLLITAAGWALALLFYTVYRWRLAYWL